MKRLAIIAALALAGCGSAQPKTSGNSEAGTTTYGSQYFERAQAHCAQYGKQARIVNVAPWTESSMGGVAFDCVKAT